MSDWIDKLDRNIFPYVEYPGFDARYPSIDGYGLTQYEADELRSASRQLFKIFQKTSVVFENCNEKFLNDMEIPKKIWKFLNRRNKFNLSTWLSRFDFVMDKGRQFHMVEINADTPCAIIESFYGNKIFCRENHKQNPNEYNYEELKDFLKEVFMACYQPTFDMNFGDFSASRPFVFSCFHDYIEDYGTTMFLMNTMEEAVQGEKPNYTDGSIRFESFYDLRVEPSTGDIILPDGRAAGAIYRLHPIELLIDEEAEDGYPIGTRMLEGYMNGHFEMFNPPEAIVMQSKAFQALVWNLAKTHKFFTNTEEFAIQKYMLPSFFCYEDREYGKEYISKPIWGREGNGIKVIKNNEVLQEKELPTDDEIIQRQSENVMYQEFVRQAETRILTDDGDSKGYMTFSCFMLKDKPSALYSRFSTDEIAGREAFWTPLYIKW